METQFIDLIQKMAIKKALKNGDNQAIDVVLSEFDRLEGIIRDYELSLKLSTDKLNSKTFKLPNYENIKKLM